MSRYGQRIGLSGLALVAALLMAFWISPLQAQDASPSTLGVAGWSQSAKDAEAALNNRYISDADLDAVRERVASDREKARKVMEAGSVEARALQAQLDVLGPAPDPADSEPEPLRKQRQALELAIAEANTPVVQAEMAFRRADALVKELDNEIRVRKNSQLLSGGPSPLLPNTWLAAFTEGSSFFVKSVTDIGRYIVSPSDGVRTIQQIILGAIILIAGGAVFFFSYRGLLKRFETPPEGKRHRRRWVLMVGASYITRLVVPMAGAYMVVAAIFMLGLVSSTEGELGAVLILAPFALIGAHWLGTVVFAPSSPALRFVGVDDASARSGRRFCDGLGWTLVAGTALEAAKAGYRFTPGALAVYSAIVVLLGTFCLWGLARVLLSAKDDPDSIPANDGLMSQNILIAIARLIQLSVAAALGATLIGFTQLAQQALFPMILSLGLVVVSLVTQSVLVVAIHALMGIRPVKNQELMGLLPLIIGLIVFLASLPLYAIIWGARVTDLSEAWILASQGVDLGGVRLSANALLTVVVVFVVGLLLTRWLQRFLQSSVLPRTRMDTGGRNAVLTGVGYLGVVAAVLLAVSLAGLDLSNLAIVAGALSVGIGFGLQAVVSNFVSGIILLVERPVKEGDWIEVAGQTGIVRKISVRSTRIETFDRHDVIVPNSELISGVVKNMVLSSRIGRVVVPVGVAYGSDLEAAKTVLLGAATGHKDVLKYPEPSVFFMGLGDSALNFELRCFVGEIFNGASVKSDLLFTIYDGLGKAGIEVPFPQRDLHVRSMPEAFRPAPEQPPTTQ